ncbi:glycosyltransferase family 4 protein, partial [Vibrio vulnificus]
SQKELFNGFDVCFTIFGPFYHSLNVRKHVVGFAQPWIAYPNNEVYQKLSLFHRMRNYLKFYIQKLIFLKYDELIVEADHVKNALEQQGFTQHIHVVPNCVSSHFNSKYRTTPLRIDKSRGYVLGYLGKPYEHKNIELFAHVSKILRDKYNIDHQFVFSLTEEEMIRFGFHRIDNFLTFGELTSAECPAFYKSLDALVFPSLLECFSASPIEAMAMGVPVIASERPFISDFCKDSAVYFDPLSSCDIAEKISNTLSKPELMLQLSEKGKIIVSGMHSPRMRAIKYMNILVR